MATFPNPTPRPYRGVEISCTWPAAAFLPGVVRPWGIETYEAWPNPHQRLASQSLAEMLRLIRESLA